MLDKIKKEISSHSLVYLSLLIILIFSASFRLYRLNDLLGFYYDQGRDALRVLDVLALRDLPAIGPITGIGGLYLGPLWFYLLAPFYFIGQGNPVIPAIFVCLLDVGAVFMLYWLGKEFYSRQVGILAAFFWGFSYYLTLSARWFSNPSPQPFFVVLLIYGLGKFFLEKKEKYLLLVSFCLAVTLQLQIASAIFFFPVIGLIWLVFRTKPKKKQYLLGAILIFLAFLVPQFLFEIKNNFLMTKNFFSFTRGDLNTETQTWTIPTFQLIKERLLFYFDTFFSKLKPRPGLGSKILASLWLIFTFFFLKKERSQSMTLILVSFLVLPLFLLFFFVGNYGQLYGYYLTGYFPVFIFLFALFTAFFLKKKFLLPIFIFIIIWFLNENLVSQKNYLAERVDAPTRIALGNQLQTIDWIYQDAKDEKFNVDVYVPPVIPYAYDYLIPWRGKQIYNQQPVEEWVPLLYTLSEVDPPHPERLEAWLSRQEGIGKVIKSQKFGGITVERRERIEQ